MFAGYIIRNTMSWTFFTGPRCRFKNRDSFEIMLAIIQQPAMKIFHSSVSWTRTFIFVLQQTRFLSRISLAGWPSFFKLIFMAFRYKNTHTHTRTRTRTHTHSHTNKHTHTRIHTHTHTPTHTHTHTDTHTQGQRICKAELCDAVMGIYISLTTIFEVNHLIYEMCLTRTQKRLNITILSTIFWHGIIILTIFIFHIRKRTNSCCNFMLCNRFAVLSCYRRLQSD